MKKNTQIYRSRPTCNFTSSERSYRGMFLVIILPKSYLNLHTLYTCKPAFITLLKSKQWASFYKKPNIHFEYERAKLARKFFSELKDKRDRKRTKNKYNNLLRASEENVWLKPIA